MSDNGMEVEKKKKKDKRRETASITDDGDASMSTAAAAATTDEEADGEVDRAAIGISVIAHPLANRKLTKKCLKLVKKGSTPDSGAHRVLKGAVQ